MKRISPVLIMLLLLGSSLPVGFASASGESTTIDTFSGGFATETVTLQGGAIDNSTTIDVPRNVTFSSVSLDIEVDASDASPGKVWIDIDEDGIFELEAFELTDEGLGECLISLFNQQQQVEEAAFNDAVQQLITTLTR